MYIEEDPLSKNPGKNMPDGLCIVIFSSVAARFNLTLWSN